MAGFDTFKGAESEGATPKAKVTLDTYKGRNEGEKGAEPKRREIATPNPEDLETRRKLDEIKGVMDKVKKEGLGKTIIDAFSSSSQASTEKPKVNTKKRPRRQHTEDDKATDAANDRAAQTAPSTPPSGMRLASLDTNPGPGTEPVKTESAPTAANDGRYVEQINFRPEKGGIDRRRIMSKWSNEKFANELVKAYKGNKADSRILEAFIYDQIVPVKEGEVDYEAVSARRKELAEQKKDSIIKAMSPDQLQVVIANTGDTSLRERAVRKLAGEGGSAQLTKEQMEAIQKVNEQRAREVREAKGEVTYDTKTPPTSSKAPAAHPIEDIENRPDVVAARKAREAAEKVPTYPKNRQGDMLRAIDASDKATIAKIDAQLSEWNYLPLISPRGSKDKPYVTEGEVGGAPYRTEFKGKAIREAKADFMTQLIANGATKEHLTQLAQLAPTPGVLKKRSLKYAAEQAAAKYDETKKKLDNLPKAA